MSLIVVKIAEDLDLGRFSPNYCDRCGSL